MPTATKEIESASWSDRILLISSAGILFLTMFPFRFVLHLKGSEGMFPFFHGSMGKDSGRLDIFLNVLLFVPFGFGLAEKLRERGKSLVATAAIALVAGMLFSYTIETLQIYIPTRDSGWEDVITNSSGSVVGFLAYEFCGGWVLGILRAVENALAKIVRPLTAALFLAVYFGVWFTVSGRLQATTQLQGWDSNTVLAVGNDTWTRPWQAWRGQVLRLEIWDRALPEPAALALTAGQSARPGISAPGVPEPLAAYDLSSGAPPADSMKFLPALAWRPAVVPQGQAERLALEGQAWLISEAPAPQLVARLENSNQFSIRVVCRPTDSAADDGRILSIGRPAAPADLDIRQQDTGLVFWFRTPLSARHAQLAWIIPGVFAAGESRDILYTYDGSSLSLFIDGKKEARPYTLGPGPALARTIRRIKPFELPGYTDIYYAILFFPAGIVLGLAARQARGPQWLILSPVLGVLLVAPPAILEILLARAGGRPFQTGNTVLSLAFFLAGALWINARNNHWNTVPRGDHRSPGAPAAPGVTA
jgi:hypothetical protein